MYYIINIFGGGVHISEHPVRPVNIVLSPKRTFQVKTGKQ